MKKLAAALCVLLVMIVGGCAGGVLLVGGAGLAHAQASCSLTTGGGQIVTVQPGQTGEARLIIGVGKTMGLPVKGWQIALQVGLQESFLHNLANDGSDPRNSPVDAAIARQSLNYPHDGVGHDHNSVDAFQQRPTIDGAPAWGPVAELMQPAVAAEKFYQALQAVPGWQDMPTSVAAQRVQKSAAPGAYARWESQAAQLVAADADAPAVALGAGATAGTASAASASPSTPASSAAGAQNAADLCGNGGVLPVSGATGSAAAVLAQLAPWTTSPEGPLPYSWGGGTLDGPSTGIGVGAATVGFDCSAYARYAYYHGAGITLPRTAAEQYAATAGQLVETARTVVDTSVLRPGDLIFYGPSAAGIHHVAVYAGGGQMYEEPYTGSHARLITVYGGDFYAATRPLAAAPGAAASPATSATVLPVAA